MTKIVRSDGCGNSPKNLLVQSLAIAIEKCDRTVLSRCVADDLSWALPGRKTLEGRAAALAHLRTYRPTPPLRISVRRAFSHGRGGAADGSVVLSSGMTLGFCHVVEFSSVKGDKISSVCTYYSELGDNT